MYADDSKSYKTIETMCDIRDLQADLNLLCVSSASNELHFQPTKCHNPGAYEQEYATQLYSYHGIFTDRFIFRSNIL